MTEEGEKRKKGHNMSLHPVSSSQLQTLPVGGAAARLVGGSSFKVLKKSTTCPGTSANTLLASASRGALMDQAEEMEKYIRGRVRGKADFKS